MANFIFLQPSCDIHLVLDPNFKHNGNSLNNLTLTVFGGLWQGPEAPPLRFSRNFKIDPVADRNRIHCDFYPLGQNNVTYDPASGQLRPLAVGEVFMQVRLDDPDPPGHPNNHHHVVARIQIHQTMNGWWFGNNSLSVYKHDTFAHSQVSIYALFDETAPGKGVVGDITGHGYINLSSSDTAIAEISNVYQDRIHGKAIGQVQLTGRINGPMLTQEANLPVEVIDFANAARPALEAVDVQLSKPRVEQHNILFVAEGFRDADKELFNAAVTKISNNLRSSARHSPYNLLKDSFNIWKAFFPSKEKGVTFSAEVMVGGKFKGWPIPPDNEPVPDTVPLGQLIAWVGLPNLRDNDQEKSVADLRARWTANNSDALLAGYQNNQVSDAMIETWKTSFSEGILQARDSFFGQRYGLRWGERYSRASTDPPITEATPTANGLNPFVQRVHKWYEPDIGGVRRTFTPDWRRIAPELRYVLDTQGQVLLPVSGTALVLDQILHLTVDPASGATGTDLEVGRLWNNEFTPDPNTVRRQINSAGLVCILVNDGYIGGVFNKSYVTVSLGGNQKLETSRLTPTPNVRQLNRELDQDLPPDPEGKKLQVSRIVDRVAHEFGHSFNLGDEYEDSGGAGSARDEHSDNLTFYDTIAAVPATPPGSVPKIDAEKIKWLKLHRLVKADSLVKLAEKISATQVKLTLAPGKVARWSDGEEVLLRKYKGDSDADHRQLPVDPANDILELKVTGPPNPTDNTITLTGANLPASLAEFRAGSMLFVPKIYKADKLTKTAERTSDTELKITLEPGKAAHWKKGERAFLHSQAGDTILELFVAAEPDTAGQTISLRTINFDNKLPASLGDFPANSLLATSKKFTDNSPLFLGVREIIDHLKSEQVPFTNNFNASNPDHCDSPSSEPDSPPSISGIKRPCKSYRLIGIYEGGAEHVCQVYRPTGACKMRELSEDGPRGEFCFVCKYLIVNRVDPGQHELLDAQYPTPKKE